MWECGLKQAVGTIKERSDSVTPYVGVWIETKMNQTIKIDKAVTPYVGVWIETIRTITDEARAVGHSLCGSVD